LLIWAAGWCGAIYALDRFEPAITGDRTGSKKE
jgi:hypothetical protein